jgi:hypothetical protein
MSLRQFNHILTEALHKTARGLPEDHDILKVKRERLAEYAIDLQRVYADLVG